MNILILYRTKVNKIIHLYNLSFQQFQVENRVTAYLMGNSHQELISEIKELMISIQNQVFALESKLAKLENSVRQDNNIEDESFAVSIDDFVVPVDIAPVVPATAEVAMAATAMAEEEAKEAASTAAIATEEAKAAEEEAKAAASTAKEGIVSAEAEEAKAAEEATMAEGSANAAETAKAEEEAPAMQLFEEEEDMSYEKFARSRHKRAIFDASTPKKAVVDAMISRQAWRLDMPGSEVRDVRSAISLNDRVLFINYLFKEDAALFHEAMNVINQSEDLNEMVAYFEEKYSEWDFDSELVYRFMMAARRKVR